MVLRGQRCEHHDGETKAVRSACWLTFFKSVQPTTVLSYCSIFQIEDLSNSRPIAKSCVILFKLMTLNEPGDIFNLLTAETETGRLMNLNFLLTGRSL